MKTTNALLAIIAITACAKLALAQDSQWLTYNNGLDSQRFSSLKQINTQNATQLAQVCKIQIDGPTSFHAGLIVSDGVIYTSTGRATVALNASSCELIWKYDYQPEEQQCGGGNRGVALHNGRIFRGTCDGRLIALDARSGTLLWKNQIANPALGESTSAAPLAWQNVIYMGIAGSELGARGRVMAYDAVTGHELWRFHTIPMGNDTGAETWTRAGTAKTGGGGIWGTMSLDVSTGELFVSVGNPWPDIDIGYRPGKNLFTNSIVVLDAASGNLKWWYQVSPSDWKDLDLVAATTLYRVEGGSDLMAIGGKDGYVTVVDRDTRKAVFRTPVTTVEDIYKKPSHEGSRMCPGYAGGVEWNGPALDRLNGNLITGAVDICFKVTLGDGTVYKPGEANFGGMIEPDGEATGWITAVDSRSGQVSWKYHAEKPVVAGITPTAGGVTFAGDLGGNFLVFNSKTGALLHKAAVGGAMAGGVVTYELGGKQYVAFAAGNISRNAFGDVGLPSVVIMTLNPGAPARAIDASGAAGSGVANGRRLYSQVCASCHGTDGNFIADHKLATLAKRMDVAAASALIKNPKSPMPKLYPELISEQSVSEVARFLFDELQQ